MTRLITLLSEKLTPTPVKSLMFLNLSLMNRFGLDVKLLNKLPFSMDSVEV